MNRKTFFEYLRTVSLSILGMIVVMFFLMFFIQHQVFDTETQKEIQDESMEYYLIGVLIEKNKYLENESPSNYKINLKLGVLYEIIRDYKNAEAEYKVAIAKAPYYEYKPAYKLSTLYTKLNRLKEAQDVIDAISEKPDKKLIEYKANIYNHIGDKYYSQGNYAAALYRYEKALFYAKKINLDITKNISNSIASSYVYLAENCVNVHDIQCAVNSIEKADSIVNAPILKYKLAILIAPANPELAYKYFNEVFEKTPVLINYELYTTFLQNMAIRAENAGESATAKLYRYKEKRFKEYFKENILMPKDIEVQFVDRKLSYNVFTSSYRAVMKFRLKNNTAQNINSLFAEVIFKDQRGQVLSIVKQVVDKDTVLMPQNLTAEIAAESIKKVKRSKNQVGSVSVEIFVSKKQNSYKILVATASIKETQSSFWNFKFPWTKSN